jgi:hypothetical protein
MVSCITTEPAPLEQIQHRPTILDDAVDPPVDQLLFDWPAEFTVPVELGDSSQALQVAVFVDDEGVAPVESQTFEGGNAIVTFQLAQPALPACHRIEFLVANGFASLIDGAALTTPDGVGGDSVTWFYMPGGGPFGCPGFEQGLLPDGGLGTIGSGADAL